MGKYKFVLRKKIHDSEAVLYLTCGDRLVRKPYSKALRVVSKKSVSYKNFLLTVRSLCRSVCVEENISFPCETVKSNIVILISYLLSENLDGIIGSIIQGRWSLLSIIVS